jgi:type IX secretion system PorP/SprF family membrane protein
MKRLFNKGILLILLFSALFAHKSLAQSEPMYSQYMFNTLNLNPGYAGSRDALSMYLLSRNQWVGFEGAPSSQSIAIHSPFYNEKIGVGASFTFDQVGPVKSSYINLNYAYKFRITEKARLSLGIKGGITNHSVNLNGHYINDASDESLLGKKTSNNFLPNVGLGAYYYTDKYYVGVSIPKLFESRVIGKDVTNYSAFDKESRHYFIMGGFVTQIHRNFKLKPTTLIKVVEGAPMSLDLNANVLYKERLWFGVMYRVGDAVGALLQYKISKQLAVGYAYDLAVSRLNSYNSGTHEIMISFDFDGITRGKVKSPRYF